MIRVIRKNILKNKIPIINIENYLENLSSSLLYSNGFINIDNYWDFNDYNNFNTNVLYTIIDWNNINNYNHWNKIPKLQDEYKLFNLIENKIIIKKNTIFINPLL